MLIIIKVVENGFTVDISGTGEPIRTHIAQTWGDVLKLLSNMSAAIKV